MFLRHLFQSMKGCSGQFSSPPVWRPMIFFSFGFVLQLLRRSMVLPQTMRNWFAHRGSSASGNDSESKAWSLIIARFWRYSPQGSGRHLSTLHITGSGDRSKKSLHLAEGDSFLSSCERITFNGMGLKPEKSDLYWQSCLSCGEDDIPRRSWCLHVLCLRKEFSHQFTDPLG